MRTYRPRVVWQRIQGCHLRSLKHGIKRIDEKQHHFTATRSLSPITCCTNLELIFGQQGRIVRASLFHSAYLHWICWCWTYIHVVLTNSLLPHAVTRINGLPPKTVGRASPFQLSCAQTSSSRLRSRIVLRPHPRSLYEESTPSASLTPKHEALDECFHASEAFNAALQAVKLALLTQHIT